MTLSPVKALALKLDALAAIAALEGWCTPGTRFLAKPKRVRMRGDVYMDNTNVLTSVRCSVHDPNLALALADRKVGWEDAEPFLFLSTAALVLDGYSYQPQVDAQVDSTPVLGDGTVGSAHDRLACRGRMEVHLAALGWVSGRSIGSYAITDKALTAITNALHPLRK